MDQNAVNVFFALLRAGMGGEVLSSAERALYKEEKIPVYFALAKQHDVAHILACGLQKNGCTAYKTQIEQKIVQLLLRYEALNHAAVSLFQDLEEAAIPFIPLKGAVLRRYYPEAWLRNSCDIDVLVKEADLDRAIAFLTQKKGYTYQSRGSHDVTLLSPNQKSIELHYCLIEESESVSSLSSSVLLTVWDNAILKEGYRYYYEMPDDMFYFYHIAHMAKHFTIGGAGIRYFLDLSVLDGLAACDQEARDALLKAGGLYTFASSCRKLARVWFAGEEPDAVSLQMQEYILRGGLYSSVQNRVLIQQSKNGGKCKYILSRIFLPYDVIKFQFPILEKHKYLTPVFEVVRWFKLVFTGRGKKGARELKYNSHVSEAEAQEVRTFLSSIGL